MQLLHFTFFADRMQVITRLKVIYIYRVTIKEIDTFNVVLKRNY